MTSRPHLLIVDDDDDVRETSGFPILKKPVDLPPLLATVRGAMRAPPPLTPPV